MLQRASVTASGAFLAFSRCDFGVTSIATRSPDAFGLAAGLASLGISTSPWPVAAASSAIVFGRWALRVMPSWPASGAGATSLIGRGAGAGGSCATATEPPEFISSLGLSLGTGGGTAVVIATLLVLAKPA